MKNGSGIPDSSPFHKKYVARPQIKFSDRPLFQKGSPGAGREPCKDRQKRGNAGTHRPAPIDRHPKINGFGLLGLLTFSKKHVVCPQKKFSDRPLFQKGAPGCRAGSPAKSRVQGGKPSKEQGAGREPCKKHRAKGNQSNFSTAAIFAQRQRTSEAFSKSEMEGKEGATPEEEEGRS